MDDLISRQAAILAIEEYADRLQMVNWKENPGVPYKAHALNWAINTLRDLPSAQPEIIRCEECRWFQCNMRMDGYLPKGVDEFECRHWCGSCDPVDFCSHAERKTDE